MAPPCHLTDFNEDSSVFLVIRLEDAVETQQTFKMEKSWYLVWTCFNTSINIDQRHDQIFIPGYALNILTD